MEDYKHKYEQALENLKKIRNSNENNKELVDFIEYNYPELKESEDERIRKEIISYLRGCYGANSEEYLISKRKQWAAWLEKQGTKEPKKTSIWKHWKDGIAGNGASKIIYLIKDGNDYSLSSCLGFECDYVLLSDLDKLMLEEKQGEQKHIDNIEPKFKVGDWVVVVDDGRTGRIIECTKDFADVDLEFSCLSTRVENIRSWTIQDAKDGDILSSGYSNPFIFSGFLNNNVVGSYCGITRGGNFHIPQFKNNWTVLPVLPATKEQRDLLFSKMKEVGYEWDAEKKELKKIEQKPAAWSEEDEDIKDTIIRDLKRLGGDIVNVKPAYKAEIDWLKSLKDRFGCEVNCTTTKEWKPSDEQMDAISNATALTEEQGEALYSLYNDLKKL